MLPSGTRRGRNDQLIRQHHCGGEHGGAVLHPVRPLIWLAMLFRMVAASVPCVSDAAAEPSELDTAIGPATRPSA